MLVAANIMAISNDV